MLRNGMSFVTFQNRTPKKIATMSGMNFFAFSLPIVSSAMRR